MSDSREMTAQQLWGSPGPGTSIWGRPPVGAWPPCPPGVRPPDCFSNLFRIEQCYEDVIQLKRFLTRIMTEILQSDPGLNVRIQGVTDASDAAPGEVGEYMTIDGRVPVPGDESVVVPVCSLQLTPGDWSVSGEIGYDGVEVEAHYTDFAPTADGGVPNRGATAIGLIPGAAFGPGSTFPTSSDVRISSATPSRVFLRARIRTVGNVSASCWGALWARRVR